MIVFKTIDVIYISPEECFSDVFVLLDESKYYLNANILFWYRDILNDDLFELNDTHRKDYY